MADIKVFVSDIEAEAISCPVPRIEQAVRRALREFCQETEAWRRTYASSTLANVDQVDLDLPRGTTLVTVHSVSLNGKPLIAANVTQLNTEMPDWRKKPGQPTRYLVNDGRTLTVAPKPDKTSILQLQTEYSLKPSLDGRVVDEEFLDQWYEAILHGALGIILGQKAASWFDRALSQQYTQMFYSAMEAATSKARGDHLHRGLVTRYGGL